MIQMNNIKQYFNKLIIYTAKKNKLYIDNNDDSDVIKVDNLFYYDFLGLLELYLFIE